jgi:transcriptional regulator with XRE-family HTH domain
MIDMGNQLRIKEILRERGISVVEFADKLGIERQNVYNVFTKPTWQRLEQCSEILNIPISEFFKKEDSEINGFVEYRGAIYRISDLQSFQHLADIIRNNNKQIEE